MKDQNCGKQGFKLDMKKDPKKCLNVNTRQSRLLNTKKLSSFVVLQTN